MTLNRVFRRAGIARPKRAAEAPSTSMAGKSRALSLSWKADREPAAEDGAERQLTLRADIPDTGAKADRQADTDQHQRRRLDHQLRHDRSAL